MLDASVPAEKVALKRNLTLWALLLFGMLCMFPLATSQTWGTAQVESQGHAVLVYLIGLTAMVFTGFNYKFMSGEFAVAGGGYSYVQRGLHPYIGFIAGWVILMDYIVIPGLLTKFASSWFQSIAPDFPTWIIIVLFLAICTTVVGLGNTISKWVNYAFFWGQMAFIGYLVVATIIFVKNGNGVGSFTFKTIYNPETFDINMLRKALPIGLLGFIGADTIASMSEEAKNAVKSVGRAVVLAIISIGLLFVLQAFMLGSIHPDFTTLNKDTAFFDVFREVGGTSFYYVTVVGCVLFVGIANVIPPFTSISRVLMTMGRDNSLPFAKFFATVNPRTNTPLNAILTVSVVSLAVGLFVPLDLIAMLVNFGAMSTYFLLAVTVFVYFIIKKKERQAMKVVQYSVCSIFAALVIMFIFSGFDKLTFMVGGAWILLGLIYLAFRHKHFRVTPLVIED